MRVKGVGILSTHVATGGKGGYRRHSVCHSNTFVGSAVNQLQKLHGELDVTKAAWAKFDLTVHLVGWDVFHHPLTHLLRSLNKALSPGGGPNHRPNSCQILRGQISITGSESGFQQCLKLPILGPALVIGNVRFDSSYQGPGFTFRT